MRLHELAMTAIGPFADEQKIDFDRLGEGGLFLFEGPTGAGKTTVLDAITFALYGAVASDGADIGRMHSHFAHPATTPSVELEFSVNGVRYRIQRTPAHRRPKKRGEGETLEPSSMYLSKKSAGNWESITTDQREAGQIVTREIGLNRDQFTQVVLLPQGEFARFLKADDDARRLLLTKMFGADQYDRITNWLKDKARDAKHELDSCEDSIGNGLSALIEAGHVDDATADDWQEIVAKWTPEVADRLDSVVGKFAAQLSEECATAKQALEQAIASAKSAVDRDKKLGDQVELLDRLAKLQARQLKQYDNSDQQKSRNDRYEAARKAAPVRPLVKSVESSKRTNSEKIEAAEATAGGPEELAELGSDWKALDQESRSLGNKATSLEHLVDIEESLIEKVSQISEYEGRIAGLVGRVASVEKEQAGIPARIETTTDALAESRKLADTEDALSADAARTRTVLAAAEQVEALVPQTRAAAEKEIAAVDADQSAVDEHQRLLDQRISGMTGELAGLLVDGEPCSVCGSLDHPDPASAGAEPVTPEQVERAAEIRDKAHASRQAASAAHVEVKNRLIAAQATAGETTVPEARAKLKEFEATVKKAKDAASRVPGLVTKLENLRARREELSGELNDLNITLTAEQAGKQALVKAVESDQGLVAAELDRFPSIADRVADLTRRANRATQLSQAVRAIAQSANALADAQQAAKTEAIQQGFADVDRAVGALLEERVEARLLKEISDYEAESKAVQEQLAVPELVGLDANEADVVAKAKTDAEQEAGLAAATENAARTIADGLDTRSERFTAQRKELTKEVTRRDSLGQQHTAVLDLDRLARGMTGERRMTLTTFVLRYWFEQVVTAANVRLRKIAGGKYELQRSEDAGNKAARVGLGLEVLDLYTGKQRSTGSLSGGETFYTSLALALGLADVVQAEAGGASLDTLFIDEGFGTLDEDTLQEVMSVIDGLRGNGRMVGIVSHVPDLKDRISERLEVRRTSEMGPSQVRVVA